MDDKIKQLVIDVEWEFLKKAEDAPNDLQRFSLLVQCEECLCVLDSKRPKVKLEIYKEYVMLLSKKVNS